MRGGPLAALLLASAFAGCLTQSEEVAPTGAVAGLLDVPVAKVADPWYDAEGIPNTRYHEPGHSPFHTLEEIEARLFDWEARYPDLVRVDVIGRSIEDRPIWDVVVTDERVPGPKLSPLIDGGHHANELAGIEIALFTVDFLLENHAKNETVRGLLSDLEVHVVPIVNPDGYVRGQRGNALGVNLNRNYDIDWGDPAGASNPVMGQLAHATGQNVNSVPIVAENCGSAPFSEPETQAMRDLFVRLAPTGAFYLTGHTPTHALTAPWGAFNVPFAIPPEHDAVFSSVFDYVRRNTEYQAGKSGWGKTDAGLPYSSSGSSQDYFYLVAKRPAFTLEVEFWYTSVKDPDYASRQYLEPYEGLRYWMDATLPIPMFLLSNAKALAAWELPTAPAVVPESSIPPPPSHRFLFVEPPIILH
ncbi:MAG: M14 family metallopeptidase [Methanobacteriota archaeon]